MSDYDVIIIGSGAGGAAAAYHLTQTGARVLLLEKGEALPRDGSTLDVARVMGRGEFLSREVWLDRDGHEVRPEEHFNLGGKTKWYGAALLRMSPAEFAADVERDCLAWPISYSELAPFYAEAERLLAVHTFAPEPDISRISAALVRRDPLWQAQSLMLGLAPDILAQPWEASHFDGFASVMGLKADAEQSLLARVADKPNLTLRTGVAVKQLLPSVDTLSVAGVECSDGRRFHADTVILAAGALHSPRLLQDYITEHQLASKLPGAHWIGRNYKSHILTAMLAFSYRPVRDVLGKTMLLLHAGFPASSVQTLGGSLGADIAAQQFPYWVPGGVKRFIARRTCGFFLQTEDGSHPENRVLATHPPQINYDAARLPAALVEHQRLVSTLRRDLLRQGYIAFSQRIGVTGTAHACGTLAAGSSQRHSVVDGNGRVWGMNNLYVTDGSILPRSSKVNPALTIYAWGLRVASLLACNYTSRKERSHAA